ncbi:GAT domain-containing protein [Zalerion maritima]|uniref:GAT domain-containing protein n=1 Tax=Zalerion maritima TaxID=339359 RepID=A0AAD5RPY4_9PEZI|nr:GAT domain-containing protein [Zalerion maritima]
MKAMKGLSMNKMLGKIQRRTTSQDVAAAAPSAPVTSAPQVGVDGTPEEVAVRAIRQFCESGGPSSSTGDEVILLPTIVDAAESSPSAAAEAARQLRKFMSKDNHHKPSRQYNALMVVRILADNPGPTFTRNLDKKFVETTKELLRSGRDPSVLQLVWETLDTFENTKSNDEGLQPLLEMWKKEKERGGKAMNSRPAPGPRTLNAPPPDQAHGSNYWARHHNNKRLPNQVELASRLEEARTSAKLLQQSVACTPPQEVLDNELIREFADRCQSASKSIQSYMVADNPAPDNDTMEALLDTNEQLQASLNQHQRAVLGARKAMGIGAPGQNPSPIPSNSRPTNYREQPNSRKHLPDVAGGDGLGINFNPPGASSNHSTPPPVPARDNGKGKEYLPPPGPPPGPPPRAGPSGSNTPAAQEPDDPFKDPDERLGFEPYHPGFGGSGGGTNNGNSNSNSGKQPARYRPDDDDDDDDGFYDNTPQPKKDPGETMLRY